MDHTSDLSYTIPVQATVEHIFQFISELEHTRRLAVTGVAVLIYDWVITFGDEVTTIWPSKLSPTKVVFLANRYINIVSQMAMIVNFTGALKTTTQEVGARHSRGMGIGN
ncbi:hypothetical protein D9613_004828 [Agrocybe pediades]|uniref:DUF6533 domain-containing protein n=1 Tax=Agrocybe pediades TaxID=84607 RepID=A0A8H4QYL7_9AGAR|nr:hypothetical protein D9613_004828 [Agrocybe pediades]